MYKISDVGKGGISTDLPRRDTPPSNTDIAHNVTAEGGVMRVTYGFSQLVAAPEDIIHMQPINDARKSRNMLLIGNSAIYAWDGSAVRDITNTPIPSPALHDKWSSDEIGGMALFTMLSTTPKAWSPPESGNAQDLPWAEGETWGTHGNRARIIKNYKNFIVCGFVIIDSHEYPRGIRWSASVTDTYTLPYWEITPENDAGFVVLEDLTTGVVDMLKLGDSLIIYGSDVAYRMQYVGGQFVQKFTRLDNIPGLLEKNFVLEVPIINGHFVIGSNDIYVHSGGNPNSVVDDRLRNAIYADITEATVQYCYLCLNWELEEVWICVPQNGETVASKAWAWNYKNDTWTTRDIPDSYHGVNAVSPACYDRCTDAHTDCLTWNTIAEVLGATTWNDWKDCAGAATTWNTMAPYRKNTPELMLSKVGGDIEQREDGGGVFTSSTIERIGLQLDEYLNQFTLLTVYPNLTKGSAFVSVGVQDSQDGTIRWGAAQLFDPTTDKKLDVGSDNLTGSLFAYRITSPGVESFFTFTGIEVDIRKAGTDG